MYSGSPIDVPWGIKYPMSSSMKSHGKCAPRVFSWEIHCIPWEVLWEVPWDPRRNPGEVQCVPWEVPGDSMGGTTQPMGTATGSTMHPMGSTIHAVGSQTHEKHNAQCAHGTFHGISRGEISCVSGGANYVCVCTA